MKKMSSFFESLVIVAIFLVLIQTFLEDLSVVLSWSWNVRAVLIVCGFIFDLFFTIEFLTRIYIALFRGQVREYIFLRKGWIDFLASIPLLMFNSGPAVLALVGGGAFLGLGGILNVLKVIKAIRIARILRLLRVLKIFKQIKYTDSKLAQRHVSTVTTIAVTGFIIVLFVFSLLFGVVGVPGLDREFRANSSEILEYITEHNLTQRAGLPILQEFGSYEENLLIVKDDDTTMYTRYDNEYYQGYFGPGDYDYVSEGNIGVFYDLRPLNIQYSRNNLVYFIVVITVVMLFLLYYSPHFALTVSDPIHVMKRGLEEPGYNLEVKIPEDYADDDIFELANQYNQVFLPLKDRNSDEDDASNLELKMDDFQELFQEEGDNTDV
ncbi:MAG: ion transporter [Spirochaetia bacterium]